MREAIGVDLYNQCITGKVAKTLNAIKSDADHVPCVIVSKAISLEVFHCVAEAERCQPLKARDYKDPLVVIYELSESNGNADGMGLSETRNAGSDE